MKKYRRYRDPAAESKIHSFESSDTRDMQMYLRQVISAKKSDNIDLARGSMLILQKIAQRAVKKLSDGDRAYFEEVL